MILKDLEFLNISNFIYFIIPILSVLLYLLGFRKKEAILKVLRIPSKPKFKFLQIICMFLGLSLVVFSLLGPQKFDGLEMRIKKGLDIYVLFDTSTSMLVEDIKPNRLSRAKNIIDAILNNLKGDRIGFIPFSSDAYIQMPLTDDYRISKMFLDVIDTNMISGGGTNIINAIKLAKESFEKSSKGDNVIIILSDGEEHNPQNISKIDSSILQNIRIYSVGVGLKKGGLIPVYNQNSKEATTYKKDATGKFVVSSLNSDILKELASKGNGNFYESTTTGSEVSKLLGDLSTLEKSTVDTKETKRFKLLYQYFLGIGILLITLGYFLSIRKNVAQFSEGRNS